MDYSAANTELWEFMIQLGVLSAVMLFSFDLRQILPGVRKTLLPTSVIAGFILLALKVTGVFVPDADILEFVVYHAIALGFIAMGLRVTNDKGADKGTGTGLRSGAIIVSTYLVQGVTGLLVTIPLSYMIPKLFFAAGMLLPMGYGQGPGQANNIGSSYEALGFAGGRSFGLAIAAAGYICACVVGVIVINHWARQGVLKRTAAGEEERPDAGYFMDEREVPISESMDKLSVQIALILIVYLLTYLASWGLTSLISAVSESAAGMLNSLIWGFNFIIGSVIAMLTRKMFEAAKKRGWNRHQYQNNYLLNRVSGFFFDLMIVCGIASIDPEDISGLWIPFAILAVLGGIVTWIYLKIVCRKNYGDYWREGLISMYGMLTGTIGSGILLLREIDPELCTPAAGNLVSGSAYGILLGAPVLIFVSLAAKSVGMCLIVLGLTMIYGGVLVAFLLKDRKKETKK